ncbi:MAG: alpha-amylase family glycosyl hydrolase [Myxococcota bacterium]|nr:alpha-amylase family glycosyl hydrolase [Myxococcota bacterium]
MNQRVRSLLSAVYDDAVVDDLVERIERRLSRVESKSGRGAQWSASDVVLIAYPDAIREEGVAPLTSLRRFLHDYMNGLIGQVHLLPFFPYTSDDGFSVSDYRAVDPQHGKWADIEALSEDVDLVFDLVINHASASHGLFQQFLRDEPPGNGYFLTADASADVAGVTRPRASPLLQPYETVAGTRHVWCTFSRDQVDWDFANPDVLFEFVDVFVSYIERGAAWMRVDAVAYLWKELGTSCVHRPQTHAIVKLLRAVAEAVAPDFKILTETNVPLAENLSYFGDGDEAHIVYNFSLPPILLHALMTQDTSALTTWCQSLPSLPAGCTLLNFVASHDGVGLRPAEGILTTEQLNDLVDCVRRFGGRLTQRTRPDGSLSPYEANIALFDACQGTVAGPDEWQVERFLVSQAVMLSMAGVPALYYNTLLAAPNDHRGMEQTGRNRTINRTKWERSVIDERYADPAGASGRVLRVIRDMLRVRKQQAGFHPEASQACLGADSRVFAVRRTSQKGSQQLLCLANLSAETVVLSRSALELDEGASLEVLFALGSVTIDTDGLAFPPYAVAWCSVESPNG